MRHATIFGVLCCTVAYAQVQIEPTKRINHWKSLLPVVEDIDTAAAFRDPATIWYSTDSITPAHQMENENETRFSRVGYNVSADFPESRKPDGKGGNANVDFPWAKPGGTHRSSGVKSFKFLNLPTRRSDTGDRWPIVWYRQQLPRDPFSGFSRGYGWSFPTGTQFGEILTLRTPAGRDRVFEVRTRTRKINGWSPSILRPYRTSQELIAGIKRRRPNRGPALNKAIAIMQTSPLKLATLQDTNRTKKGFVQEAWMDVLPDLEDDALVEQLFDEPFKESFGDSWKGDAIAPTTDAPFHIVPTNYDGAFLGDCMSCHDSTGQTARSFDRRRGWYGNVRGSDGILSFHPVARSAIGNGTTRSVVFRREFVATGILERFDPTIHPNNVYTKLPGLR